MIPAATCPLSARDGEGFAIARLPPIAAATNNAQILRMDCPQAPMEALRPKYLAIWPKWGRGKTGEILVRARF